MGCNKIPFESKSQTVQLAVLLIGSLNHSNFNLYQANILLAESICINNGQGFLLVWVELIRRNHNLQASPAGAITSGITSQAIKETPGPHPAGSWQHGCNDFRLSWFSSRLDLKTR